MVKVPKIKRQSSPFMTMLASQNRSHLALAGTVLLFLCGLLLFGEQPTEAHLGGLLVPREEEEPKAITSKYYKAENIVKLAEPLAQNTPQTVVTAYFQIRSKYTSEQYDTWIKNMLSMQDPMVIFLSPALIPKIREMRQHALNKTVIIPMEVEDVPLAVDYNTSFWEHQFAIDKEARTHKGYHVFWIWLSKTWWVNEAIRHNFFNSQVFVWTDMGCFRNFGYEGKEMVLHPEIIPRRSMLFMAHHPPNPPPERVWNNKYTLETKSFFYHSGSIMAGYADTFQTFHNEFTYTTIPEFLKRDMFIGEDQTVMQSTCLLNPPLCAYIPTKQVQDNHYFGLRTALHRGGDYKLWYSPALDAPLQTSTLSIPPVAAV